MLRCSRPASPRRYRDAARCSQPRAAARTLPRGVWPGELLPPVAQTSSTVYTVGDGDGLYSSNTVNDWTKNSTARGFRCYNRIVAECNSYYQTKYVSMNARWQDAKNSSDGTDNSNSNTFGAGYHSHVSPTFTFRINQQGIHYGAC